MLGCLLHYAWPQMQKKGEIEWSEGQLCGKPGNEQNQDHFPPPHSSLGRMCIVQAHTPVQAATWLVCVHMHLCGGG